MEPLGLSLLKILDKKKGVLSKSTTFGIISQLIDRLQDLHNIGVIHGDIKLDNIMIGKED